MDFLLIHQVYTVVLFVLFVAILGWAWDSARQSSFHTAAHLPFIDSPTDDTMTAALGENHHE